MEYRKFGRTGIKVSPLCLGTMNFGYRTDETDGIAIVHAALDAGINFIDTANIYGRPAHGSMDGLGASESIVGKSLPGKRDRVILATKVSSPWYFRDINSQGLNRKHIMEMVEGSLKRLQTDYIDLYQMHVPDTETPVDEILRTMDDLVRSGKVRYIGTSNHASWQIMDLLWEADKRNSVPVISEQPLYNMLLRANERELIPMAIKHNIALMPWSPLGSGVLAGKYKRGDAYPDNSRLTDEHWQGWSERLFIHERTFDVLDVVEAMAEEKNCSMSQLSLAWNMNQPGITSPIIGPRTMSQLEDNLGAVDVQFSQEDFDRIDAVAPPRK